MGEGRGWLGRRFHRLTADNQELEDEDLQRASVAVGAEPMLACRDREEACVAGSIRSVTVRARSGGPSLEVDLYDGSGTVTLVFLGRKHIAGIEAGRSVKASGRVVVRDERTTIFNPRYELLPVSSTSA
ncbi:OB-fold nucleic acid binding domain-containing protein [Parafrankia irregularis]|uniref:OB-fold nucleic acid binding domain-containing protein n=1 Tax=Parafrankia irregularis TaxID=795642 RepID=A0A0S4QK19_9ACTN|nr:MULTISPECIES: OB-fold nucleic acid binding domain-containing protein [Parafrankia]MBE3202051.1 OB-fold nucleic acid binding domain-containing protein [Parafrankia sp. CH37]CUU55827.1 OB-fold nucleic acid binding domain-containing protein [Parafrankia irregularis]